MEVSAGKNANSEQQGRKIASQHVRKIILINQGTCQETQSSPLVQSQNLPKDHQRQV